MEDRVTPWADRATNDDQDDPEKDLTLKQVDDAAHHQQNREDPQ